MSELESGLPKGRQLQNPVWYRHVPSELMDIADLADTLVGETVSTAPFLDATNRINGRAQLQLFIPLSRSSSPYRPGLRTYEAH